MGKANQIFSKIRFPNKNISSVEELLGSLAGVIEAVKNNPKHAIKFVIIDSLSSLFSALRNKTNYFTKSLEFLKLFQELTNKYSIGVIVRIYIFVYREICFIYIYSTHQTVRMGDQKSPL